MLSPLSRRDAPKGLAYNTGSLYALSYLGLGRADAMAGKKPDAKKAYDVFFTEWRNADPDRPVIAEARKGTLS